MTEETIEVSKVREFIAKESFRAVRDVDSAYCTAFRNILRGLESILPAQLPTQLPEPDKCVCGGEMQVYNTDSHWFAECIGAYCIAATPYCSTEQAAIECSNAMMYVAKGGSTDD